MLILIQGQSLLGNKTKQCSVDCLLNSVFEYKQISRAMADLSSLNNTDKELKSSEKSVEPNIDNVENLNPQLSNTQTETSSQCATTIEANNNPHQQTNSSGESLTTTTKTSEETIEANRAGQKRPHCGRRHRNHRHHHHHSSRHEHSKHCHHHQQQKNQGAEKITESSKQGNNDDDNHRHHQHYHHAHRHHHHHHHHHHHDTKRHGDSVSEIELATASIARSSTIDLYDATDSELNVLSLESSQLCHKHQQKRQQLLLLKQQQQQETNEQAYSSAKSNDTNKTKDAERHHHNQGTCNRRSHHQHRHQNEYLDHDDIETNQIEISNKEQDDIVVKQTKSSQTLGKVSSNEMPRKLQVVSSSSSATVASANTVIAKLDTNSAMFDSAFDTTNQTESKMNKRSPLQSISSNACSRKQHRRHHHLHNNNNLNKQEPQDSSDRVNESEQKSGDDRCSRHQNHRKDHSHHRRRSKSSQIAHQEEGCEATTKESSEDPSDARKHHHHGHHHHAHRSHHGHHHHHHHHHRHHGHHHHSTNKQFKSDHAKLKQRLSDGEQKPVVNDESLLSREQSIDAMKEVDEEKEGLVEMDGIQLSTPDINHRGNLEEEENDAETANVGDKKSIDQQTVEKHVEIDTIEMDLSNVHDATGTDNSIKKHQSKEVKISKNDKSFFADTAKNQVDAEVNVSDSKKNSTLVNTTIDKPAENLQVLNDSGEIQNNNSGRDIKEVVQNKLNEQDKNIDQSTECPSSSSHRNQSSQDDKQVTCDMNAARVPSDRRCRLCWCWCCPCSSISSRNSPKDVRGKGENNSNSSKCLKPTNLSLEEIRSWNDSFDKLMKSEEGRQVFQEFLRCEYSEENILFWSACEALKKEKDMKNIVSRTRDIYEDFISILSAKEVSLDSRVRDVINNNIKTPTSNIFDEAQLQIYTLMHRDSYPRFINSTMYKNLAQLT